MLDGWLDAWLDAWLDVVVGSRCSGCGRPGRALCPSCEAVLQVRPRVAWPTPTPRGLLPPFAATDYDGVVRAVVVDHKEHGRLGLARPLGRLLAAAVVEVWRLHTEVTGRAGTVPVLDPVLDLVPVPSHGSVVRGRGHDPLLRMARVAAATLRDAGGDVRVRRLLRVAVRPGDQAGLGAAERQANLHGRFALASPPGGAATRTGGRPLVLVDDVITTGATLREAQRALESAGLVPLAAATVAATRRRRAPRLPVDRPGD